MSAAALVRTARLRAGLDQSALAKRASTSQPNVCVMVAFTRDSDRHCFNIGTQPEIASPLFHDQHST